MMNRSTEALTLEGPAGRLQAVVDLPAADLPPRGVAVLCHPHPQHGGTMDNKVVQTLARAVLQRGWRAVRFNFRGVGESQGQWDEGQGEIDDALAVAAAVRQAGEPLLLGGFSFGGFVAAHAGHRLQQQSASAEAAVAQLLLVGPATSRFELPRVPANTVVFHGEADEVVPLSATLAWARGQTLPVTVLPGVGHFFHGQLTLLKALLVRAID